MTKELELNDLNNIVRRLPKDVRDLLSERAGSLFVGGGFLRAVVAGEEPSDIDLFGADIAQLKAAAEDLQRKWGGPANCRLYITKNAVTVLCVGRTTVQFITRWTFTDAASLLKSFDFTVCQAAVWLSKADRRWKSARGEYFYVDLAARRLNYTNPIRDEEAGGSLLRAIKYLKRGYVMQVESLADVVARLASAVDAKRTALDDAPSVAFVLRGLLREVDPLHHVDGLEILDDPETPNEAFGLGS